MRSTSFKVIAVIALLFGAMLMGGTTAQAQEVSHYNMHAQYLAVDSSVTTDDTVYSQVFTNFSKTSDPKTTRNFLKAARLLIMARDTVYAAVSLQFGQRITGGTRGATFAEVFLDTIASNTADTTKSAKVDFLNIDLTNYMVYPQLRLVFYTGSDAAFNKTGLVSALFEGVGLPVKNDGP